MRAFSRREFLVLAALSAISVGAYLWYGSLAYGPGFPLDDSWIHQAYARNLAERGEWSLLPGQPSAGATSPLWVAILSIGYFLSLSPFVWTAFLGWLCLFLLGILSVYNFKRLFPNKPGWAIWVGGFTVLEWHMVWAAVSGMETILFIFACMLFFTALIRIGLTKEGNWVWVIAGLIAGFSIFLRPDGITLQGVALLAGALIPQGISQKRNAILASLLGFLPVFLPYLAFNYANSGDLWPNTFYAKQAEYAILLNSPLIERFLWVFRPLIVGASVLLIPGGVSFVLNAWRDRRWAHLLFAAWVLGYLLTYAMRLPLIYQHGRYQMPAMAAYFFISLAGVAHISRPNHRVMAIRVLNRTWLASIAATLIGFWVLGGRSYADDVGWIHENLVTASDWINENTSKEDVVATHDIGALGYFAQRPLVDLAGLISPEIIPFIRDEARLADYLETKGVDYLVTFPSWYPLLVGRGEKVFQSKGEIGLSFGLETIGVYAWPAGFRE